MRISMNVHGAPKLYAYYPWNEHSVSVACGDIEIAFYIKDAAAALRMVLALNWTADSYVSPAQHGNSLRGNDAREWCERRLADLDSDTLGRTLGIEQAA